jgi:hypothetical protein
MRRMESLSQQEKAAILRRNLEKLRTLSPPTVEALRGLSIWPKAASF